jgi:hypothetical protein
MANFRTIPCLDSESSDRLRQRVALRNPFSCGFPCTLQTRLKAVTVSGHKDSWNETPFRPLVEALDPYRAGNRCALKSLDTDRSTTLSPETVTANVYLQ